jgi:hypothetical protein
MNFEQLLINGLIATLTVSHVVRLAFYWPQMRSLWKSVDGGGIAVPTWAFWSFHSYLTVAYLLFVAHDYWLATLFLVSGICTSWIAFVAYAKQSRAKPIQISERV